MKCEICEEDISLDALVSLTSNKFNSYLREYHIYSICPKCYEDGRTLFREDLEVFISWLEEHDNRTQGIALNPIRQKLRRGHNLSIHLLSEDPEEYQVQMDKYAAKIEDLLVFTMDRYNLDLDALLPEFEDHKVQML